MKKIAIICCDYPLHTATLVLNSIEEFIERGAQIDIFCSSPMDVPQFSPALPITVTSYREDFWTKLFRKLLAYPVIKRLFFSQLVLDIAKLSPYWASFAQYVRKLDFSDYKHILCISYPSLFCFAAANSKKHCIYYNMELLDDSTDTTGIYINKNLCRQLEKRCLNHISNIVAMSPDRAKLFQKLTQIPESHISVLPILPRTKDMQVRKSDYFRSKFSIAGEQKIVIYSGGIGDWAMLEEIIETIPLWPSQYVLIIHTWQKNAFESSYGKHLQDIAKDMPVFFSEENLSRYELIAALSAADIGIAFYRELDGNFTNIVFSSNKICEYLLSGLPVICSPFPSLKHEIDHYQLGKAVPISAIPAAITEISAYEAYIRNNINKTVRESLNFDKYFTKFYQTIA